MVAPHVEGANTLLQREQTLVDFGTFETTLSVVTLAVGGTLRTSQVDQKQFTGGLAIALDEQLADGVTARGRIVSGRLMSGTDGVSIINNLLHFARRISLFLFEAIHLNLIILVFENLQLGLVVEQIHAFTAINFKHGHEELDVGVVLRQLEDVIDSVLRDGVHCERFTRTGLTISKTCDNAIVEYGREKVPDRKLVHILRILVFVERVVKLEVDVIHILCDAIDLDLRLMNNYSGITGAACVNFTRCILLVEKGPFTHTNANVHFGGADVVQGLTN